MSFILLPTFLLVDILEWRLSPVRQRGLGGTLLKNAAPPDPVVRQRIECTYHSIHHE